MDGHGGEDAGAAVVAGIGGLLKCMRDRLNKREWFGGVTAAVVVGYAAYSGAGRMWPQLSWGELSLIALLGGLLSSGVIVFAIRIAEYTSDRGLSWLKRFVDARLPLPAPVPGAPTDGRQPHDPAQPGTEPVGPSAGSAPVPRVLGDGDQGVLRSEGGA